MKKKKSKIWVWLIIIAIAVTAFVVLRKPDVIETVVLKPQLAELTFTETGIVTSESSTDVYSLASGEIKSLNVKEGQKVSKGQTIATIDVSASSAQVASLQAQLDAQYIAVAKSQSDLEYAQDTKDKMEYLYNQGVISESDYDKTVNAVVAAQAGLDAANAQVKILESNIEAAEVAVKNAVIKAPIAGVIDDVLVEHTNIITAGQPVVTIISNNTAKNEIEVYVSTKDVDSITLGQKVELTLEGRLEDKVIEGTVAKIAEKAESKMSSLGTTEYKVKITLDFSSDLLKEGYSVDCKFTYYREENKIVVPKSAIWSEDDIDKVYVKNGELFEERTVKKGIELRNGIVVESGLKAEEEVAKNCEEVE